MDTGCGKLVDVSDAACATGVDARAAAAPGDQQGDEVDEEPEAKTLIAVDPEEDQQAWDEQCNDGWNEPNNRRNVTDHTMLQPRHHDADARQKERKHEEP